MVYAFKDTIEVSKDLNGYYYCEVQEDLTDGTVKVRDFDLELSSFNKLCEKLSPYCDGDQEYLLSIKERVDKGETLHYSYEY